MTALFLAPPVVAFLLLAAHFYRGGNVVAVAIAVLPIALIFVRRPWAARTIQAALALGTVEWLLSATTLALARSDAGQPYLRLAIILGAVALFTALAALVVQTGTLRRYFGLAAPLGA